MGIVGRRLKNPSFNASLDDGSDPFREEEPSLAPLALEPELHQPTATDVVSQEYSLEPCIPRLIELQAAAAPDAVALVAGEQVLTYRELNRRANQLAHRLRASGVSTNALVGLHIERSLDLLVGMLGILKAGGAYVPVDPSSPGERIDFMLGDAGVAQLVTQQHLLTRLPVPSARVICLDADRDALAQESTADPVSTLTSSDLAYVIYTSGSTGQPKGVQITHGSLLNLILWHQRAFDVSSAARATHLASPAFDAAGWEVWPYLTLGASVYLPADDIRITPVLLRDWLVHNRITITFLPTALAESIMQLAWPAETALRFMLTGADTLHHYPPSDLPFTLVNNYGPTEATVVATSGPILATGQPAQPPPIGRPIANTQIYILDEHLRQVPGGEPGELYIGGAGLAKGYLNRPDLTAEKFIAHPFSDVAGARLYRTGDLARYLPDGQIAFMGRVDYQVKIRGYRIEPDEIAYILNRQAQVRSSLVIAREDIPTDKRLVAYIVLEPSVRTTAAALRAALAKHLPDYMLPSTFVVLDRLPMLLNGKVDRAALPVPSAANTLGDERIVEPDSPTEERLVAMVASILEREMVGVEDNFFTLGGHSLLATQLILSIADSFGVELPLRTLFETPTVRQLAVIVEQRVIARLESMSEEEIRSQL